MIFRTRVAKMDSIGYGLYRSKDPIQNFKIRVRLERLASINGINASADEHARLSQSQGASDEMELSQLLPQEPPNSEIEEYTFSWQEKVFSQHEHKLYSIESQCDGSLKKKYHRMIEKIKKNRRKEGNLTNRLFTYTDNDLAFAHRNTATFHGENETLKDASTVRRRHHVSEAAREWRERNLVQTDIVNHRPTDAQRKEWHNPAVSFSVMHIMADVGARNGEETGEGEEVILCTIRADSNGVVIITPDFNAGQKPYRLETGNLGRDVYLYTLEHASNCITAEEKEQEIKMFQEFYYQRSTFLASQVGHEFQEIPVNALRLHIFGEIVSAEDYEYDQLYINFFVEMPGNWIAEGDGLLYGVTQACTTKCFGNKEVAHFSFPFAYQLLCPLESLMDETTGNLPRWPQLCFQVMSQDSWKRYRTEGYGYIIMPTVPGVQTYQVKTWRPVFPSIGSRLRRYFVGGSPELDDLSSAAITTAFQEKRLSRYGMQTESSGTVVVRIHSVQQCQEFTSLEYQQKLVHLKTTLRLSTLQSSVAAVLQAFQRARQRMLAARGDIHL